MMGWRDIMGAQAIASQYPQNSQKGERKRGSESFENTEHGPVRLSPDARLHNTAGNVVVLAEIKRAARLAGMPDTDEYAAHCLRRARIGVEASHDV